MKKTFSFVVAVALVFSALFYPVPSQAKVVKEVLQHAGGDIKNSFFSWPALVIVTGGISSAILTRFDDDLGQPFQHGRHLGKFDSGVEWMGQPYIMDPMALLFFGLGRATHNEELAFTGENLFESLVLTQAVTAGLKFAFQRERPNGGNYSFPSAHAANFFAFASVMANLKGPIYGIPAFAAAGLASFSRVDANVHHVSDVVFGAALGAAIGWGTSHFHKKEDRHLFLAPMVGSAKGVSLYTNF